MTKPAPYEILGIGNAFVDYLVKVPHEFIDSLEGSKHGMLLVEHATLSELLERSQQTPTILSGGSSANVLKGLSRLGHSCALLGPIGKDDTASIFKHSLDSYGIASLLVEKSEPSPQVICLIDPEGRRTFRSFLGAAKQLTPEDIDQSYFQGVRLVHIEGYSLKRPGVLLRAVQCAKKAGAKISIDLASHEIVSEHYDELLEVLRQHLTIVFCNEDEATALSLNSPEVGCKFLRDFCDIAVVSKGTEGCLVGTADGIQSFPAYPVKATDTTGAGDFFSSGFLHGYLSNKSLTQCAHFGAVMGNAVVQTTGAEIPLELLPLVKKRILEQQ
ncbi:MAG: adenosine kinase [Chlamydiales bacterium]|nr:adenosine kinase [Chlamydiales bacterium]